MSDHILHAYELDGMGGGSSIAGALIDQQIQNEHLTWVHMDAEYLETRVWLEREIVGLDHFVIDALLAEESRPRVLEIGEGVLINLRGVNLNVNADPEDMVSIRLWVDQNRIISVRRRRLKAVQDMVTSISMGKGPKTTGDFVCMMVSLLLTRMNRALSALDDQTDSIETQVLESANVSLREEIVNIRKEAIFFRRYIAPQREAISQLRSTGLDWFSKNNRRHLHESLNEVTRYIEDLDSIRERAQIVKDELVSIMADKLNKNMYVLSVIAAIFLPLGFLTGLLGVNIGGIPGTESSSAFWLFSLILIAIIAIQIWIFKKNKWF